MDLYNLIGYIGTFLYLLSYFLLNLNKIDGNGICYILINMIAAIFVSFSLTEHWNAPSFVIQVSWIIISIFGLIKIYSKNQKKVKNF